MEKKGSNSWNNFRMANGDLELDEQRKQWHRMRETQKKEFAGP